MDVEYLKNTVLKMYRTGEAEALLPVFSTILSFSPDEMKSCKDGLDKIKQVCGGAVGNSEWGTWWRVWTAEDDVCFLVDVGGGQEGMYVAYGLSHHPSTIVSPSAACVTAPSRL